MALVAGATRGAGRAIAVELARAGFFVYATGRSSRSDGPSEIGRPETIEETGELILAAGGEGSSRVVDHEDPAAVAELVADIQRDRVGWTSSSTTSSEATGTWSGISRSGSTNGPVACGCCRWGCTRISLPAGRRSR